VLKAGDAIVTGWRERVWMNQSEEEREKGRNNIRSIEDGRRQGMEGFSRGPAKPCMPVLFLGRTDAALSQVNWKRVAGVAHGEVGIGKFFMVPDKARLTTWPLSACWIFHFFLVFLDSMSRFELRSTVRLQEFRLLNFPC
jgi:hypothetical protein